MGIESGPSGGTLGGFLESILQRGEYFRNPELARLTRVADHLFRKQGDLGEPVIIDPPIKKLEELLLHESTYSVLLAALFASQNLPSAETCLIGGIAAAAHTGKIYREHKDIDIAVTREFFDEELNDAYQLTNTIYTMMLSEEEIKESAKAAGLPTPKSHRGVRMDFFVYDSTGLSHDIRGGNDYIPLGRTYPLRPDRLSLYGIELNVAPYSIAVGLKAIDSRPKGKLDFQMLTGARS